MGKKNKQKNNNNIGQAVVQKSVEQVQSATPIIKVSSEEDKLLLDDALKEIEKYCEQKRKEADDYFKEQKSSADDYYSAKKVEADGLKEKAEGDIQKEVDKAVKAKEKEMKDEIDSAKREANKIISEAEAEAKEKVKNLEERQVALEVSEENLTKKIADLELTKLTYKQDVLARIQSEILLSSSEREQMEKELERLKKDLRKKDSEIKALEEDRTFYDESIAENTVKRSEILSYKTKIATLEGDLETINGLYAELQEKNKRLNAQILLFGDDPSKVIKENAELTKRIAELQSLLSSCPTKEELDNLRANNAKFEELKNKLEILKQDKLALETENIELKVDKDEIESYRKFIKILELQKAELQRELNRNIELYNNNSEKIFATLSQIDETLCNEYPAIVKSQGITLKILCDKFRGYLANRAENPLYYEEKTIRTFIAGFASSRIMILEGLSGTGKSSLPRAFADFMGSKTIEVPVQSSWKDRNDLLGFYNDFKKQYKETEFLKALYKATHDNNNIYVIVLDEMNLSRIEYYFADLLSVLEKPNVEDWKIELISDYASVNQNKSAWPKLIHEGKLQISDNTWFVGTANKDDSTFIITDKVYDRSVVLNFDKKGEYEKIAPSRPIEMSNTDFQMLLRQAQRLNDKDDSRFKEMMRYLDETIKDYFQITFGNRIVNQLEKFVPVYVACGGTVDEAVDVMFSRKVLRKLEGIYDETTKMWLEVFKEDIKKKNYNLPITIKAIEKMVEKI